MSATYTLMYWPTRGRGEQVRLMLHELDQSFEEQHYRRKDDAFQKLLEQGPKVLAFGSVPMLAEGDFRLVQAPVILSYLARKHKIAPEGLQDAARADAIAWGAEDLRIQYFRLFGKEPEDRQAKFVAGPWAERWLPAFEGLLDLNGNTGFFVGDTLTHADIAVWDAIDACLAWVAGATLDGFERLQTFRDNVANRPRIKAYLESDARPQG